MTIEDLRNRNLIIFEAISGSNAYGLQTPESDIDIKGVFLLPKEDFYSMNYIKQINDETNDTVFYELGRFLELLSVNSPNILELLNTPEDSIIYKHPYFNMISKDTFISKLCKNSFGKYAISQIKKSKGLNKKIMNPMSKDRQSVLDFCYVNYNKGSIPIQQFLDLHNLKQEFCGLVNIPNMKDLYGLYYSEKIKFSGIVRTIDANDVALSSIPKDLNQIGLLYFNRDGYSVYCKDYREYWAWVEKRNDARYQNTLSHGKNYDAKNMMHVIRLLDMAIEIGKYKKINVRRENREFLLDIKSGLYDYDELLAIADKKASELEQVFDTSDLPDKPNIDAINYLAYEIRNKFYNDLYS